MKKLSIFETEQNMTYDQILSKIKNSNYASYNTVIDSLGLNGQRMLNIPMITDKNILQEMGFDTSYCNRMIDFKMVRIRCRTAESYQETIRDYFRDYFNFYDQKRNEILKYINESTKISETQRSDLSSKLENRFKILETELGEMQNDAASIANRQTPIDPYSNGSR